MEAPRPLGSLQRPETPPAGVREAFLGSFWCWEKQSERKRVNDTIGSEFRLLQNRQPSS